MADRMNTKVRTFILISILLSAALTANGQATQQRPPVTGEATITVTEQFFNSLKRGTGEAYLILQDNPNIDFSDIIIKGAITNYAYDQQSEGSRAVYVYRLIKKVKQKDKIIKAVLTKL